MSLARMRSKQLSLEDVTRLIPNHKINESRDDKRGFDGDPSWQLRRLPCCVKQRTHLRRHLEMSKTLCHQDSRAFISCSFKREFCKLLSWPQTSQHVSQLPVKPYLKHILPVAFSIDYDFIGFPKLFSRVASALEWHGMPIEGLHLRCHSCDPVQRRKRNKGNRDEMHEIRLNGWKQTLCPRDWRI